MQDLQLQMGSLQIDKCPLRPPLHCVNETFLEAQVRGRLRPPAVSFKLFGESHKYILEL